MGPDIADDGDAGRGRADGRAETHYAVLGTISFGLAVGVTFAVITVVLGLFATFLGWGLLAVSALSSIFVGYGPTIVGIISGGVWAFVTGYIIGLMIAYLYNRFLLRRRGHPSLPR